MSCARLVTVHAAQDGDRWDNAVCVSTEEITTLSAGQPRRFEPRCRKRLHGRPECLRRIRDILRAEFAGLQNPGLDYGVAVDE